MGRPDESLTLDFVGPLQPNSEENVQSGKLLSFSLQKGQLRANACYQPQQSATLEVLHSLVMFCLIIYSKIENQLQMVYILFTCLVADTPLST